MTIVNVHSNSDNGIDIASSNLSWLSNCKKEGRWDYNIRCKVFAWSADSVGENKARQSLESNDVKSSILDKIFHYYFNTKLKSKVKVKGREV